MHEKTTYTSRVNALRASMRRPLEELEAEEDEEDGDEKALAVKDDPSFTIAVTRGKT